MQDPEAFLSDIGIDSVADPLEPERAAVLDAEHRVRINHDVWFFADAGTRARFAAEPLAWVELLTDPVNGERFRPGKRPLTWVHAGRTWYFARPLTRQTFKLAPERFLEARARMRG